MKPRTIAAICGALLLLFFAAVQGYKYVGGLKAETRLAIGDMKSAQQDARAARTVAAVAVATADRMEGVANAYKDTSAKRLAAANGFKHIADSLNREFEIQAANSPPECEPALATARLTIATKDREIGSLRISLGAANHRGDTLEKALLGLKPATAGLIVADAKLDTAATKVADVVRPPFLKRMVHAVLDFGRPKIGIGAGITYDPHDRKGHGGPTLLIGWTF